MDSPLWAVATAVAVLLGIGSMAYGFGGIIGIVVVAVYLGSIVFRED